MKKYFNRIAMLSIVALVISLPVKAHHSFAMYDVNKRYNLTGVVTRILPNTSHLAIYIVPLNESRDTIIRDENGEPWEWSIEMYGSAQAAVDGISVNDMARGSIISIGLNPLRNGKPAGYRNDFGLFKCPDNTPPATGLHCDSVAGATSHGRGVLTEPTGILSLE